MFQRYSTLVSRLYHSVTHSSPRLTASLAILVPKRSPFFEISISQKSERDTISGLSRPHSPVPQAMHWSQTETSKCCGPAPIASHPKKQYRVGAYGPSSRDSLFFFSRVYSVRINQHCFLFHSGFGFCGIRLGHRPIDASKTHDHATLRELLYLFPPAPFNLAFMFSPQHLCVSMCAATNTVSVTEITGVRSDTTEHGVIPRV